MLHSVKYKTTGGGEFNAEAQRRKGAEMKMLLQRRREKNSTQRREGAKEEFHFPSVAVGGSDGENVILNFLCGFGLAQLPSGP